MAYAHHGEVEIHYDTYGAPFEPALLLVSGSGSQCINYREEVCERLATLGYYVIRYDNRDVGLSSAIAGARFTVIEGMGHDHQPQYWGQIIGLLKNHLGQSFAREGGKRVVGSVRGVDSQLRRSESKTGPEHG